MPGVTFFCVFVRPETNRKGCGIRLGTRPGNSSLARKIRVSGTKMAYSILENSIQVITFFRVDISEVNYATCRYIIDNIQTHFPF